MAANTGRLRNTVELRQRERFAVTVFLAAWLSLAGMRHAVGENMQAADDARDRTIAILGASYARGWGSPTLPGYERVINRGAGGEETGDMLKRFGTDVVALEPDAVLIWGHVNNITRASPEGIAGTKVAARKHYTEMLRQARAAGIEVIFATEIPWTEPGGWLHELQLWIGHLLGKQSYGERVSAHVRELNDFLRELAQREKLVLLDFERVFAPDGGTRKPEFGTEDGSHISQAGYTALTRYSTRQLSSQK
ncbi:MAG: SGNH/GDSL hydrolase family protein [Steroidobacteraceae bacterium]